MLLSKFFEDFLRILSVISVENKVKAFLLFVLMAAQSALELLFILTLTYMAEALTAPQMLRERLLFRGIFAICPSLEPYADNARYLLLIAGCIVIFVSIMKSAVSWISARSTIFLGEKISVDIGKEIMSRFLHNDYSWHLSSESTTTFQRLQWRGQLANMLIFQLSMYSCLLTMGVLLIGLIHQEPMLTLLVVGTTSLVGFVLYRLIRLRVDKSAVCAANSAQEETSAILCATKGIREVLIYRQQEVFLHAMTEAAQKGIRARVFNGVAPTLPTWVLEATGFTVVVAAIAYLTFVVNAGIPEITTALGLLMLTAWRVLPYANRVVGFQVSIRAVRPMVHAVLDLLYLLRAQPRPHLPAPDPNFTFENRISLHQVCFQYAGSQVDSLHNLTFDIPIGQKIGVIGPSGAGKSTLVGVLSGLLYPRCGTILVDGTPLDPGRAAAFAQLIGYVPQQPFLFAGTLAENVAFSSWGRPWDKQRVMEACQRAAVDFITTHPDGINQRIGENGAGLSGGQAQRVSIARALYCRPKLLIFDEATSALDQANENHIQNTIDSLANEVTCVIIAHRLTTVENCDSIIWVDNGHLVMHDETNIVLEKYKKEQLKV